MTGVRDPITGRCVAITVGALRKALPNSYVRVTDSDNHKVELMVEIEGARLKNSKDDGRLWFYLTIPRIKARFDKYVDEIRRSELECMQ